MGPGFLPLYAIEVHSAGIGALIASVVAMYQHISQLKCTVRIGQLGATFGNRKEATMTLYREWDGWDQAWDRARMSGLTSVTMSTHR